MPNKKIDKAMWDKLHNKVSEFVLECQFIEATLKLIIENYTSIIREDLKGSHRNFTCRLTYEDLENFPLGRLITEFKMFLNKGDSLIGELGNLKKKRDEIIHSCYLLCFAERKNKKLFNKRIKKLDVANKLAKRLFKRLRQDFKVSDSLLKKLKA